MFISVFILWLFISDGSTLKPKNMTSKLIKNLCCLNKKRQSWRDPGFQRTANQRTVRLFQSEEAQFIMMIIIINKNNALVLYSGFLDTQR